MSLASASSPLPVNPVLAGAPLFRLAPEKYRAMVRDGILTEDDPFEYLQGVLVEKMTKSDRHIAVVWFLRQLLDRLLPAGCFTLCQDPIDLVDSEPEPDITVVRGEPAMLFNRKPLAADIELVVEVSDSTLRRDRELKRAVFAAAGLPQYWIVNLVDNVVEVYREPDLSVTPAFYRSTQRIPVTGHVTLDLSGVSHSLSVADILGL